MTVKLSLLPLQQIQRQMSGFLLQLDANLIEGEPYNRLARKNKRRLNVARQNSNISEMWETGFKNPPRRTASVWGPVQCHRHTDFLKCEIPIVGHR